jgi:hypothetical protein
MYKGQPGCILDEYGVVHYEDFLSSMGGHGGVLSNRFRCCMVHDLDICFPLFLHKVL